MIASLCCIFLHLISSQEEYCSWRTKSKPPNRFHTELDHRLDGNSSPTGTSLELYSFSSIYYLSARRDWRRDGEKARSCSLMQSLNPTDIRVKNKLKWVTEMWSVISLQPPVDSSVISDCFFLQGSLSRKNMKNELVPSQWSTGYKDTVQTHWKKPLLAKMNFKRLVRHKINLVFTLS